MRFLQSSWFPVILGLIIIIVILNEILCNTSETEKPFVHVRADSSQNEWMIPDINTIPATEEGNLIRYGRELMINTSKYLGGKGVIASVSNGMNCQNCHLDGGLRPFGNSFLAVASTYPKYRNRSGRLESIEFRINECMERSLNGKKIDSLSKEMRSMVAYLKWVGQNIPKGVKPAGAGIVEIPFIDRAADPSKGKIVYDTKCKLCHQENGSGIPIPDSTGYIYPPLWGKNSYNVSAGIFRLLAFASFVKYNMPFTPFHSDPQLTDEEAFDVAAFVNSQPRPIKFFKYDWPKIETKPVDHPFGPYTDGFTEKQHKYGPFSPIKKAKEEQKSKNAVVK